MRKLSCLLLFLLVTSQCFSQSINATREIAITIDDLPLVASKMDTPGNQQRSTERFTKIVQAFSENNVPTTGFVIAGAIGKGQWAFIEQFRDAGLMIGNHTYSHFNLNNMSAEKYIADVDRADKKLAPVLTTPKYFRYPYLAEGSKLTKPKVLAYLVEHHYTIAPVTIDSKDYRFNEQLYHVPYRTREAYINKIKPAYLAYIWSQTLKAELRAKGQPVKQILLIHANLLNSYVLGDIIQMYKKNGYTFISLTEALKNPAPALSFPAMENEPGKSTDSATE
ncbi:MAG: polysaccharide deacetylase [Legionellales bacterium RIFCSPHIGHO2_12_FULL_35_11]|nr:MAG: polysaccharide deacetylase [Legionellales bacterium RIFCSPHIGHO2_12_FULL_35_11]